MRYRKRENEVPVEIYTLKELLDKNEGMEDYLISCEEIENLWKLLFQHKEFSYSSYTENPDQCTIPTNELENTEENEEYINNIIDAARKCGFDKIKRTPKDCIGQNKRGINRNFTSNGYELRMVEANNIEFLICTYYLGNCRIKLCNHTKEDRKKNNDCTGLKAWSYFSRACKKFGLDPNSVENSEEEGIAAKEDFPKPIIMIAPNIEYGKEFTYENAHHIDIHSAHCAGMSDAHPEFRPVFESIYKHRKEDPMNKHILTHTWGFAQSKYTKGYPFRWAQWSKAALEWTNDQVLDMSLELEMNGRKPLLFNTDGIWYQGDRYSPANEGGDMGQWAHDHTNCRLRIKSAGSYEFMEGDTYQAVVRGRTRLDKVKPREEWEWGDIFQESADKIFVYGIDKDTDKIDYNYISINDLEGM